MLALVPPQVQSRHGFLEWPCGLTAQLVLHQPKIWPIPVPVYHPRISLVKIQYATAYLTAVVGR